MFRRFTSGKLHPHPQLANVALRFGSGRHKVVSSEDAAYLIPNGATITVGGFAMQNSPEEILEAIAERFRQTGTPKDLTLLFGAGPGDAHSRGIDHLAIPGLLRRVVGSHYGFTPLIGTMVQKQAVEGYALPLGVISQLVRAAASGGPAFVTTVGYGTLVDPKNGGGKMNKRTTEDLVTETEIFGQKYLVYRTIPIDVAIIRGTTADPDGNLTFERESLYVDNLHQAMAARSRRGVTIAQVKRVAKNGTLNPRDVHVPGTVVDAVVVAKPENHWMSYVTEENPAVTGQIQSPSELEYLPLDARKIIARRAIFEITPNNVVNIGIGVPRDVASVAEEEKVMNYFEMTTEAGTFGGVVMPGKDFGPAVNYDAMITMNQQLDFYTGGGLDACFLGMSKVGSNGDVNVAHAGDRLVGPGGFIDISQSTKNVNILGTFTADGLEVKCVDGKVVIITEGKTKKFVNTLKEVSLSAEMAIKKGQHVHYITERCVFALTEHGLELEEIAPGIDLQRHILDMMEFTPVMRHAPRTMRAEIFLPAVMNVAKTLWPQSGSANSLRS